MNKYCMRVINFHPCQAETLFTVIRPYEVEYITMKRRRLIEKLKTKERKERSLFRSENAVVNQELHRCIENITHVIVRERFSPISMARKAKEHSSPWLLAMYNK